jgi:hypothetical protein
MRYSSPELLLVGAAQNLVLGFGPEGYDNLNGHLDESEDPRW